MRLRFVSIAALVAATFVLPRFVPAQSLGDLAAQEKEKRKAKKPAKVFTEEDLEKARGRTANTSVGTADAPAAPAAEGGQTPADSPAQRASAAQKAEQEKNWRERVKAVEADVARLTQAIETLSGQYSASVVDPYNPTRQSIAKQLEDAKTRLADKQKAMVDLQEEGRKNGYR